MRREYLPCLFIMAWLGACGGGTGDGGVVELTGIFRAGGAEGVRYVTPTHSGTTDAAGRFRYVGGETVAFSVGGIELGSAKGAGELTPFTLAGGTPPTTELALRRELDRARRVSTPFVRAINIQRLMMSFDSDHDPANGLQIDDSRLTADAEIDCGLPLREFAERLQKLAPGLTRNLPLSRPAVMLYRALGITIPVHAQVRLVRHSDGGPQSASLDGYEADGSHASSGFDADDDGVAESIVLWNYDPLGRIHRVELTSGHAGPNPSTVEIFNYDSLGTLTGGRMSVTRDDGALLESSSFEAEVDAFGFQTTGRGQTDSNGDGTTDVRTLIQRRYDAHHNDTGFIFEIDSNADGIPDERDEEVIEYDALDRPVRQSYEIDLGADGIIDERNVAVIDYPTQHVMRIETELDSNADGMPEAREIQTSVLDASNNLIGFTSESDSNADGVIDSRREISTTFDADGRVLQRRQSEQNQEETFSYDAAGNLQDYALVADHGDSGLLRRHQDERYEFGAGGEALAGYRYDYITGGHYGTISSTTTIDNELRDDGTLLLAQKYLDE